MKKVCGKIPVNARITIDYENEKPKVKFDYPRTDVVEQNRWGVFMLISLLLTIFLFFILFYSVSIGLSEPVSSPTSCDVSYDYKTNSQFYKNITLDCDNGITYVSNFVGNRNSEYGLVNLLNYYVAQKYPQLSSSSTSDYNPLIFLFFIIIFYIIFLTLIIYLDKLVIRFAIKFNWIRNKIPVWNAKLAGKGYRAKFTKVPENKIIEIPLFKNFYMDYKTTKQFAKYLKKVEIKEHPFEEGIIKKGRIKKAKKNVNLWYARFYFSEIPITGELEVYFK